MVVPYPFSKAIFLYGEPIEVPRDADVEQSRLHLEHVLIELEQRAENEFDALFSKG